MHIILENTCAKLFKSVSEQRYYYCGNFAVFSFSVFTQILGLDSEFCIVESFITGVVDYWPDVLRPRRIKFTIAICLLMFLLGVPMVTDVRVKSAPIICRTFYNCSIKNKQNETKIKMTLF